MEDIIEITIKAKKISGDQYWCNGVRLAFDLPWSIYMVCGDLYVPYYRVYVNNKLMCVKMREKQCYDYLLKLTKEQVHIAEM